MKKSFKRYSTLVSNLCQRNCDDCKAYFIVVVVPEDGDQFPFCVPSTVRLEVDCLGEAVTRLTGDGTECDMPSPQ